MSASSPFIVGVTGGIGSGKTAATDIFIELGIEIVDADIIARQIVAPEAPALMQIISVFGEDYVLADGNLNRAKLRELIFSDDSAKDKLNSIMHPAIRNGILKALQKAQSAYVILSAPLLLENKLDTFVSRVMIVDVDESLQQQRASQRDGVDEQQIKQIIASQIPRKLRLAKADDIVDNSKSLVELRSQIELLHNKYLQLAGNYKK